MKRTLFGIILMGYFPAMAQLSSPAPSPTGYLSADNGLSKEVEMLKQQTEKDESLKDLELFTRRFIEEKRGGGGFRNLPDTSCVVTIPVVFHVYHPNGEAGVPLSQIDFAIADLNKTFAGKDADYNTVNTAFANIKSYTKIRFARALRDPKGNPTTGVVYYNDKQSGYGNGSGWDNQIATCAWDNYKYFNVYVMNDLYADNVTNNSGVCWYPSTSMNDAGTARMVYNYAYLGQGGASQNNLEFNQTFTHESGHFLNLAHTFDGNNCTGSGDNVNDTPPTDIAGAGCNATRCGGLINGENYMDYNSSCYKNFTMGQNARMEAALSSPARASLGTYENLVATGLLDPLSTNSCVMSERFFAFSKAKLQEDIMNNGSIEAPPVTIYACGSNVQFAVSGTLTPGTHYTITNLPSGLAASIVVAPDMRSAVMTITGTADNHGEVNSINNIQVTFTNAAVLGGNVNQIQNYTKTLSIAFKDPWIKTCATPNITTTSSSTWNAFVTEGPIPRSYGLWYNNGAFYLENYGRGIITTGASSDNIQFLAAGADIGPSSTWRAGGTQGVLYSSAYSNLNNQTGYVGFRMQAGTDFYYGWMEISVSSTNGVTLLEYQYNKKPNEPIAAGSICSAPLKLTLTAFNAVKDGTSNLLTWKVITEAPGDHFIVERSADALNFYPLADVMSKATSSYQYRDRQPLQGTDYYRLTLVDADGSQRYSEIRAVHDNGDGFTLEVFPNPVNDQLSIRVSEIQGQGRIDIVDVTGRRVLTDILKKRGTYEVSLGHFSPGVYFVQYHDDLRSKTIKINKY